MKKSVLYDKRHDIKWEYENELQDVRNKAPISLQGIDDAGLLGMFQAHITGFVKVCHGLIISKF